MHVYNLNEREILAGPSSCNSFKSENRLKKMWTSLVTPPTATSRGFTDAVRYYKKCATPGRVLSTYMLPSPYRYVCYTYIKIFNGVLRTSGDKTNNSIDEKSWLFSMQNLYSF